MPALLTLVLTAAAVAAPADATKLTFSPPAALVEIDTGKLKGDLTQVAWSPDATELYLQTIERDRAGNVKNLRHYVLGLDGKGPKGVKAQPPWAAMYWTWKSAQSAPGLPSLKIQVEQRQKRVTTTSIPTGGDMARGSPSGSTGGTSVTEGLDAGMAFQTARVFTLKLKGTVVGEFVNAPAVPGLTFGWGPKGSGLIAFANDEGTLVVMDDRGRTQEVRDTKAAQFPAWTDDGKRLAYLERTGRKKMTVRVVEVTDRTP